jgi:uncharacterized protein YegJ (DUF2314 family)
MRALIAILTAFILVTFSGCSRQNKEAENYTHVDSDDAAMNAAIAKAKATSADFIRAFHEQKPGTTNFSVKKPYPVPGGGQEHMWIDVLSENNGVIEGQIDNDAEETKAVKLGQKVSVKIEEISDWFYMDGKKLIGGYTIRYFIDKMSPKERETYLKQTGWEL